MERYAKFVIKRRKGITVLFIVIAAICVFLSTGVRVNYNLAAYLPESAQSTKALEIMGEEFTQPIPNTSVMVLPIM